MSNILINDKIVGDNCPCYVVFEAGPTHDGVETACDLVDLAADASADAIKFQMLDPDRLIADREMIFSYQILQDRVSGVQKTVEEPLYNILKRRVLTKSEWRKVRSRAREKNIAFFLTIGFEDELKFALDLDVDSIKIASADLNHFPLIRLVAQTGLPIQIDTGSSSLGDVERAVDCILKEGNKNIVIHQCPSGYPARIESINLNMIKTMKCMFDFPIAFSDHSPGWEMDIAAVALGANMLEKTITKNRTTPSVEHIFSLEGDEPRRFIKSLRDVELALGGGRRVQVESEIIQRNKVRRSIFSAREIEMGELISIEDITFRRPGYGIQPDLLHLILGRRAATKISKNQMLLLCDVRD